MYKPHPQLDPNLNRERGPWRRAVSAPPPAYPDVDPADPYRNTFLGLFDTPITDEAGQERKMILYVPTTERTAWNMVLVLIPGGEEPREFFEKGGWQQILEKHRMSGFFLPAPDGWKQDDPGFELETAQRALAEMRADHYFQSNYPAIYCIGFGDAAPIASLFAVANASTLAGFAACGDTAIDDELLQLLGDGPSDCDAFVKRREVPLPAMILDNNDSNIVDYFRAANHTADEGLCNTWGKVYRQQPRTGEGYVNSDVSVEVWHGKASLLEECGLPAVAEQMVAFVEAHKRWAGFTNGDLRRTVYPEEEGMKRTDVFVGGLNRYWLTFEPDAYHRGRSESYPLIIAIHGFTCTGEFFANNSGWHRVAQERGAFVVYPTAYPSKRKYSATERIATPAWNSGSAPDPDGPDDLGYFELLIKETLAKYPIDPTRVYVTGHSNGSMMTQLLMRRMPQYFAGFAPVGAMEGRNEAMPDQPDDGLARNVWYIMGEFDGNGCSLEDEINIRTLQNLCRHNKVDYNGRCYYESGMYQNSIFKNAQGVPMVRFTGIKNWPHTYSPEIAYMIYDQFFSRFRREADGKLVYLG